MDEADQAQEHEEAERQAAISRRRPTLQAIGCCWYCREPLRAGVLFCDLDCKDEHEREESIRERQRA